MLRIFLNIGCEKDLKLICQNAFEIGSNWKIQDWFWNIAA